MNEPHAAAHAATRASTAPGRPERSSSGNNNSKVPLRSQAEFLRGFVRAPRQVGSVIPSSHRLEQRIVRAAALADAQCVVELGPGTGGTTAALLAAMRPGARLLAIELDPAFHAYVGQRIHDPRLTLELGSAEHIGEYLQARRLPAADVVVSGIPFSTMPAPLGQRIAQAIEQALRPGGRFVAYQFRPDVADYASPLLGMPQVEWELVNVPPMRVYRWTKQPPR